MTDDPRQWVLEHEGVQYRFWHWYPDGYFQPAKCGRDPIPGMPQVDEVPHTWPGVIVCHICAVQFDRTKADKITIEKCGLCGGYQIKITNAGICSCSATMPFTVPATKAEDA